MTCFLVLKVTKNTIMKKQNSLKIKHNGEPPSYLEVIEEKFSSQTQSDKYSSSFVHLDKKCCSGYSKKSIFDNLFIETIDNVEKSTLKLKILQLKEENYFAKVKTLRLF